MKLFLVAFLPAVAFGQFIAGGISETTVQATDEPVVFAVKAINDKFAANNGHPSNLALREIVKARTQVVNGQNLYLTLHMDGDFYCDVTVWYRAYLQTSDRLQVTDGPTCTKHQSATRVLGSPMAGGVSQQMPVDGSDVPKEVLGALDFATCSFNDRSNNMFAMKMAGTAGVTYTQQVTAGMTYTFYNVPMVSTHCHNEGCSNLDLTQCNANVHEQQTTVCTFTVQSAPWLNPPISLSHMEC